MSNKKDENNTDYLVSLSCKINSNTEKKIAIYLPYNESYKPITEAIIKVCSLFSDSVNDKKIKDCTEEKKTVKNMGVVLVVCKKDERAKMIKHPDCYWIDPEKLSIGQLVDPANNADHFPYIVNEVYEELMRELSHP